MSKRVYILCPLIAGLGLLCGCGKKGEAEPAAPRTPKQAASQLEQVFVSAPPEVKTVVQDTSTALQSANYEKAIRNLETIKTKQNLTLEQGMAVHNSMLSLEASLVQRVAAGDPAAIKAYEQLKRSRRN